MWPWGLEALQKSLVRLHLQLQLQGLVVVSGPDQCELLSRGKDYVIYLM